MLMPVSGADPLNATDTMLPLPETTVEGLNTSEVTVAGLMARFAEIASLPDFTVSVAIVNAATPAVLIRKLPVRVPSAITIDVVPSDALIPTGRTPGWTEVPGGFVIVSIAPPLAAAVPRVTVPIVELPPTTLGGASVKVSEIAGPGANSIEQVITSIQDMSIRLVVKCLGVTNQTKEGRLDSHDNPPVLLRHNVRMS